MIKYSILIPFFNRTKEFGLALNSYEHWYGGRDDYEVVIGNDIKNEDKDGLSTLITQHPNIKFNVFRVGTKDCICPGPSFNFLAKKAAGEILILTNPETVHLANILDSIKRNMWLNGICRYLVFACEAGFVDDFNQKYSPAYRSHMWYQHSVHNNRMLHFCSAIDKSAFFHIGGFDEGYARGVAYDDNDFVQKIKNREIPILPIDTEMVLHIEHDRSYCDPEKVKTNKAFYEKKWGVTLP